MLAAVILVLTLAVVQAEEGIPASIPDEVVIVWGSVEARKALEQQLWDLGYRLERERKDDRVILLPSRKGMPTVILHDEGWMELRDGAFQTRNPAGRQLARWLSLNFVNPRKIQQAKGKLLERTQPLVTLWREAIIAESEGDPDRLPRGADLDAALASVGWDGTDYTTPSDVPTLDDLISARGHMVDFRLAWSGLAGMELQDALKDVPRERFLDREDWVEAYADRTLEDPDGRTVLAPSRLAWQIKAAGIEPGLTVLELSRESGYRAAVLASLGARVRRVEEEPAMAFAMKETVADIGADVVVELGALAAGWASGGPYDVIIVDEVDGWEQQRLAEQLREGGRLLVVEGTELTRFTLRDGRLREQGFLPLGYTPPHVDRPWVPDAGIRTPLVEEHTPGFD